MARLVGLVTSSVECRFSGSHSGIVAVTWAYASRARLGLPCVSSVYPRGSWRSRAVVGPSLGSWTLPRLHGRGLGADRRTRVRVTFSVSGLLSNLAHVRQAWLRCLRCCPGVTVTTLGRPSHRARSGHGQYLQIRSLVSDPDDPDADLPGPDAALRAVEPLGDDRPRSSCLHRLPGTAPGLPGE
jgi:hypothetical protein